MGLTFCRRHIGERRWVALFPRACECAQDSVAVRSRGWSITPLECCHCCAGDATELCWVVITTRDFSAGCNAKHLVQCPQVSWALPPMWWGGGHSTLVKPGVGWEAEVAVKGTELPRKPAATICSCPCWIPEPSGPCKDIWRWEVDRWEIR